ncbi:PREDICTED: chitinase-like protein PB1E7.04c [Nelumbo nucifera]|uniref:Chitinase-like protein PB1E7.04c n=2 Tax=Nelumbo nucifera TaxID=4432 RepID=A0A1U8B8S6_NELNU|nr:PREDICTED: chitinase-like protein PB1E7.04c [Nelumbo nucifera]DAD22124.1 TPA_asm: hypothetical protein HUJ06_023587 [Nelumbo nucifera]
MTEKKKKKKKGSISEEDISVLLQRYTATTILALLQEVAQFADTKIDWDALVKKTTTGISNAREYQMLWRHLAYRHPMAEKIEDGAEPLDDDSDLELELEAFPPVGSEASTEAAACVKVLIASGLPSDSGLLNHSTVEAPLTINIPNGQAFRTPSEKQLASSSQGTNITIPVSVQKQPLPTTTSVEGLDGGGSTSGGLPARRKRKLWTAEEDMELIAAVQKFGEGNWSNILKGDYKGDRTASQLSQRWAIIRKRQANLNLGGVGNSTSTQLSEAQLAARRAVSLALDGISAACSTAATLSTLPSTSSTQPATPIEASLTSTTPSESSIKPAVGSSFSQVHQSQQSANQTVAASRTATSNAAPRSRATTKKSSTPVKSTLGPNPMVQAAAVAAGARIANPSTAASLLKAAQSKNAVHIRPGGGSLMKASVGGNTKPLTTSHAGPHPNVHYICTGLASPQPPTYSGMMQSAPRPGGTQQAFGNSVRSAVVTGQPPPVSLTTSSNLSAQQTSVSSLGVTPCGADEGKISNGAGLMPREELKSGEETKAFGSANVPKEPVQYDEAALPKLEAKRENETSVVENEGDSTKMEAGGNGRTAVVNTQNDESQNSSEKMVCSAVVGGPDSRSMDDTSGEKQSVHEKQINTKSVTTIEDSKEQTDISPEMVGHKPSDEKYPISHRARV